MLEVVEMTDISQDYKSIIGNYIDGVLNKIRTYHMIIPSFNSMRIELAEVPGSSRMMATITVYNSTYMKIIFLAGINDDGNFFLSPTSIKNDKTWNTDNIKYFPLNSLRDITSVLLHKTLLLLDKYYPNMIGTVKIYIGKSERNKIKCTNVTMLGASDLPTKIKPIIIPIPELDQVWSRGILYTKKEISVLLSKVNKLFELKSHSKDLEATIKVMKDEFTNQVDWKNKVSFTSEYGRVTAYAYHSNGIIWNNFFEANPKYIEEKDKFTTHSSTPTSCTNIYLHKDPEILPHNTDITSLVEGLCKYTAEFKHTNSILKDKVSDINQKGILNVSSLSGSITTYEKISSRFDEKAFKEAHPEIDFTPYINKNIIPTVRVTPKIDNLKNIKDNSSTPVTEEPNKAKIVQEALSSTGL
jgi:hypothetical protein